MPRYAAIDIGSNSLRMQVAETAPGQPMQILAAGREITRLGESVFRNGVVSQEAMQFACSVLARMAGEIRRFDVAGVRAVATSAVRDTRNQAEFVARASDAAGTQVEIISGREESRLIHLGVHRRWPDAGRNLLILDIGGGSAEIISSEEARMRDAFSKPLGAVRLRENFLKNDPAAPRELHQMGEYIDEKLGPVVRRLAHTKWERAVATSATASAVVCAIHRVPRARREEADRLRAATPDVRKLYRKLSALDLAARRKITGINARRAEIIVPGVAVLLRFLELLRLPGIYYSVAGVRDGIIADLAERGVGAELARLNREQRREVERMCRRYAVPLEHARQVANIAQSLFAGLQRLHALAPNFGKVLEAAAYLHDVGHYVSDSSHHKHSYYLVANSDMPGFTNREREFIAALCRYHRKALPDPGHNNLHSLGTDEKRALTLLIPLLRIADNLDRSHEQHVESLQCDTRDGQVTVWLTARGDTDLEQWAAERTSDVFRQAYGKPVAFARRPA